MERGGGRRGKWGSEWERFHMEGNKRERGRMGEGRREGGGPGGRV
jgi:hypothetical protein